MPFPQRPGKHREPSLFTPRDFHRYLRQRGRDVSPVPARQVVVFSRALFGGLRRELEGSKARFAGNEGSFTVGRGSRTVRVSLCPVGAPALAIHVEEMVDRGARRIVSVGYAGALSPRLAPGESVLCSRALRDEGTSYHYARTARFARPPGSLTRELARGLRVRGLALRSGPSWTVDAIYRETRREARSYAQEGILTVEMEASALFAVARYRGIEAAAVFTVSDHLYPRWRPSFHLAEKPILSLAEAVIEVLPDCGAGVRSRTPAGKRTAPS